MSILNSNDYFSQLDTLERSWNDFIRTGKIDYYLEYTQTLGNSSDITTTNYSSDHNSGQMGNLSYGRFENSVEKSYGHGNLGKSYR